MPSSKAQHARELSARIAALSDAEREALAARLPQVFNPQGHLLTFHNTALLYEQSGGERPLTCVAGFQQWKRAGRIVRKGERCLGCILVPIKKRDPKPGERDVWFKAVPVFDISQTDETEAAASSQAAAEAA